MTQSAFVFLPPKARAQRQMEPGGLGLTWLALVATPSWVVHQGIAVWSASV